MEHNQSVLDILKAGGTICYAPVSGGLVLIDHKGEMPAMVRLSMAYFINLRSNGLVELTDHMDQGHHILHGKVDFYKISPR